MKEISLSHLSYSGGWNCNWMWQFDMRQLFPKVVLATATVTLLVAGSVRADDDDLDHEGHCRNFSGPFSSTLVPPPTCTSPIGLCTHEILTGDFPATYDFTFETLANAGDVSDPTKFLYWGAAL